MMTLFRGFAPFMVLLSLLMVLLPIRAAMSEPLQEQTSYMLQGMLEYVFGDNPDHTIAIARYFLSVAGTRTELLFDAPPWHGYLGKQVVVEGTAVSMQREAISAIRVSRISMAEGVSVAAVTGTRKVILLLVKFSGDSQEPHSQTWYTDIFNPSSGNTVNSFYLANSWGQFGWSADVTNWMTGMDSKTTYANCGWERACLDWNHIFNDAVALGVNNGVNFDLYENIAIVTNNDLDCCAWGGGTIYNGRFYGVVWQPPWSAEQGVFDHELGHSIGLPHSGWVYYAYDSPWDVMSNGNGYNGAPCGTYFSANSGESQQIYCYTPADIIAPYKDVLGWIDSSNLLTVTAGTSAGVQVDTLAASLSGSKKMIKICVAGKDCTSGGATAQYYTVEVRTHYTSDPGFDYYLQNEGVIIHYYWGDWTGPTRNSCYFNYQFGPAYPIDNFNVVPSPHYVGPPTCSEYVSGQRRGLYYANWNDGQIYDNGAGMRVGVVSHSVAGSVTTYLVNINPINPSGSTVTFYTNPTTFVGTSSPGSITSTTCGGTFTNGQSNSTSCGSGFSATADLPSPSSDWQFHHWKWSGGVSCSSDTPNPASCTITGSGSLKAVYSAKVTIQTDPTTAGSISWGSCSNSPHANGQTVYDVSLPPEYANNSITACYVPSGYTLSGWSCSGGLSCSGSSDPVKVTFTGPGTITAAFKQGSLSNPMAASLTATTTPNPSPPSTTFTVSGRLTAGGTGLGGKQVLLFFTWNFSLVSVTTRPDGSYSYTATAPSTTGTRRILVLYSGDLTGSPQHMPSLAITSITV